MRKTLCSLRLKKNYNHNKHKANTAQRAQRKNESHPLEKPLYFVGVKI